MAVTDNTYTGNGSTTNYSFTFPYLEETDIKVTLDGVLTTAYTLANATTVSFTSAPGNGVAIRVYRETDADTLQTTFFAGSAIRAQDLNDNFNQVLYNTQETVDRRLDRTGGTMSGNIEFTAGKGIVFEGTTNDANEVTLLGGDPSADRTLNLPNASGTLVSTGDVGTVATSMIADSNVTTAKIADSNVTTAKIADSAVTSAKIADGTIATADLADGAVTSAKIADGTIVAADIAADAVTTAKILDANVTTAKIADSNVTTAKIADSAVTAAKIADGVISTTKLTDGTVVTNAEHSASTPNDTSFFTTSASDARYFRQDSTETIFSGDTWSSSDSRIASTAAIDARIIDLVDDVGGFVPIANETSFPLTNPDINNPDGAGTIISIKEISTSRTPSSGIVTITNGAGTNTVTINGCGSTVLAAGFGVLVETTSTLHTYTFHRLVPKATEVTTVAGISSDVTTVATNSANVTAVASNAANVNTVAGSIANVNNVGGSIANVNSVASNLNTVNDFAARYRVSSTDPTTSLDTGDLVFNTTNNELRVFNGSAWQGGVTATGNLVSKSGDTLTGPLGITAGTAALPSLFISGDPNTGAFSPGADQLSFTTGGTERLSISAAGAVNVPGALTKGGNNVVTVGDTGTVTSTMIADGTLVNADINASAAIAGTKINSDFGSQFITTTGSSFAAAFIPSSSTAPSNGVYLPAANSVAISTNGSGRLFVNASGHVSVGNTSPQALVHFGAGTSAPAFGTASNLLYGCTAGQTEVQLRTTVNDVTGSFYTDSSGVNVRAASAHPLSFHTSNTERMRLDSSGRLGLGTSTVSSLAELRGSAQLYSTAAGFTFTDSAGQATSNRWFVGNVAANTYGDFSISSAPNASSTTYTSRLLIDSSGRVGIGTTSPSAKLHLHSGQSSSSVTPVVRLDWSASAERNNFIGLNDADEIVIAADESNSGTDSNIQFRVDASEKARIDSSGRLLVGTSSGALSNARAVLRGNPLGASETVLELSRGGSVTAASDGLGTISFTDSSSNTGARILAESEGSWTSGSNHRSRLVFSTTADGASSPTERLRIAQNGAWGLAGANYGSSSQVLTSNGSGSAPTWQSAPTPSALSTASGSAPSYSARAWANFNSSGTIQSSGNTSSITKNAYGRFTWNFATSMPTANYALCGMAAKNDGNTDSNVAYVTYTRTPTVSSSSVTLAVRYANDWVDCGINGVMLIC